MTPREEIGVVAIGRNEGQRLESCLASVAGKVAVVVYVDSASTDGSQAVAQAAGVEVVELDMSTPFTAARARNAGFERLGDAGPGVEYVQFLDADCSLVDGWLPRALEQMKARPELAAACGRRRERYPQASIYNRLADIEWDTPVGDASACGGDALIRASAFRSVGGFDPKLIAGEEPEMCVRLRQSGWKIARLDAEMTLHDSAMLEFGQWWRRSVRAGHAYAEGAHLHGRPPERHWVREVRSNLFWGLMLPLLVVSTAWPTRGASLLLVGGYAALWYRIRRSALRRGLSKADSGLYARFCVVGKFAQVSGQVRYHLGRLAGRRSSLIEYKNPSSAPPSRPGISAGA